MPQVGNFTPVTPTYLTRIDCPNCQSGAAHLTHLLEAITVEGKGEIRVFECSNCRALTEIFVRD